MIVYVLVGLSAFCIVLYLISQGQSDCVVLITGESVRVQGCRIDGEFGSVLSKLKPFGCGSFRS
ncbi:7K protein [Potato virus M]|uniref:Movement protein TGBp3 n=1 Tax=Potato virus M (strain Russian) TaxID=12168 RepID=TGB3_PVMR|nr:7K protein [Potato virus M]P17528.1 RecName: Full=Movement protein TGBp3; AltName: Full=7 kDa protein; AltName: Full=Triple gene block 3 protein; Short=TGBp3 [Potato virus M (strain Russian)]BAA03342.1 7K protein [Potato virus M]